ncbi:LacI family DNA-binding transcriptional regulator [Azohydromonas caseinilytica]|uniref:LacI family DNA-binding transcriptional regulator n=1 Tax=Azohydromonas caseinilytica TaxID=2728836 RepID=A0A848FA71_9BURK|nr:LacI family DNA-binding transcriptional regulator [Azohydromonas caseinilytica]NML15223.1 LacI family DNA-binding transcriptional regulator [Azohydromonas caseinilytica]
MDDTTSTRRRRSGGGITLGDVARIAGVAPITASRALNTPSQVSPQVLQRVREAVQRTGYVPNLLAGGLASRRSRLVAAVVPSIAAPVFMETVQALTEALAGQGYQLMLGQSGYAESREDELLEQILGRRPDGLVLTGVVHSAQGRRRLQASGLPVVETWDFTPTPIDMLVGFSHEAAAAAMADHLVARGHRRLAVLGGDDARALRRQQGFIRRAQELGCEAVPALALPAPTGVPEGRAGLRQLLERAPQTRAVFCASDALALGALAEAQSRGLRVPQDLAIAGFGDMPFAASLYPALTTVRIDGTAIGRHAARFILERVEGREVAGKVIDVGFSVIQREST